MEDIIQETTHKNIKMTLRRSTIQETSQIIGFEQALQKHYKEITYLYIQEHLKDFDFKLFPNINDFYHKTIIPNKKNSKTRFKYVLVTVNPHNQTTIQEIKKCYEKAMKKKYIMDSLACIEWTSEPTEHHNGNMHIHMRLQIYDKDPYRIKREIWNNFKYCTSIQCVNTKYSNTEGAFIKYLEGYKINKETQEYEEKPERQLCKRLRKEYNIPEIF